MRICILGLGNVGKNLLEIMQEFSNYHRQICGESMEIVCVGDSRHTIVSGEPMDIGRILYYKKIGDLWSSGYDAIERQDLFQHDFDVLVDLSTASRTGEPGKKLYEEAFRNGRDVVTANKSPLAMHWNSIMDNAKKSGRRIRFEATVAGGLPLFNFIEYSLSSSPVIYMRGIVNGTGNYVLHLLRQGNNLDEAISHAQKIGIAEADPSIDIDGFDNAWKASIIANFVSGGKFSFRGFHFGGIREELHGEKKRIRLISEVRMDDGEIHVFAGMRELELGDPLLNLPGDSLGYIASSGTNSVVVTELHDGPRETASAVMNDLILLSKSRSKA
ncbi:MAG: homoserine dehydrogenase [Candidatus Thermoplasmatota archaeon]|nr:homoserine dehydrogenase [Candidatus Thermoplasmatota archaeon]